MRWYSRHIESRTGPLANLIIWSTIVILGLLTLAALYWASIQPEVLSGY